MASKPLIKALPPVPKTGDKPLLDLLEAIKSLLEVREGVGHTNMQDRNVTFADLQQYHAGSTFKSSFVEGPRGYPAIVPKPPTSLVVAAIGVTSRKFTWTWPLDSKALDAVEVWRSWTASRSEAARIALITFPVAEYSLGGFPADTAAYFWIRILRGSSYSPWEPPDAQGGYVVAPADIPTVNDLMNELTQMDRYTTSYTMILDAFQILQPSGAVPAWTAGSYAKYAKVKHTLPGPGYSYYQSLTDDNATEPPGSSWLNIDAAVDQPWPTFTIGNIDGIPTVGVHGDMLIDHSLLARHISATEIYTATIASSDYVPGVAGWKIDAQGLAEFNNYQMVINYGGLTGTPTSLADISSEEWAKLDSGIESWTVTNFIDAITHAADIADLQDQIDGAIETWFYDGVPGPTVLPESDWLDPDTRILHKGDLYYDGASGVSYRYSYIDAAYEWVLLTDSIAAEALALAGDAWDLADGKRRIFVVQPAPPYDLRDLWLDATGNPRIIRRCTTARATGVYTASDWTVFIQDGAPAGTLINGVPVEDITGAIEDFNAGNNRIATAVVAPAVAADGTAIDHALQSNASADISFEWSWSGAEGDIDGFVVYTHQDTAATAYVCGTTPAAETAYVVPSHKRAFVLFGVAPQLHYTFGVQAYRRVDQDINAGGLIQSAIVQSAVAGENPYRPAASVAYEGDVIGTIDGMPASELVQTAVDAEAAAALAQAAADERCTTFVQAEVPVPNFVNDYWIDKGSENVVPFAEDLEDPYWYCANSTLVPAAIAGPAGTDGALDAYKIVENLDTGVQHYFGKSFFDFEAGTHYLITWYFKAAERHHVRLFLAAAVTGEPYSQRVSFDLSNGEITVIGTSPPQYYAMEDVGDGWYRCAIGHMATISASQWLALFYLESTAGIASYNGDGVSGLYCCKPMVTATAAPYASPTRYVPTDGAAVSTVDGNKPYRWDGTVWESAQDYGISQAMLDAAVAQAAADDAQLAADTAQDAADTANTNLADIASDDILTPDEKPRVIMDRDVVVAEQAGIDAQATAYAITTEKTAYDTAIASLTTYLATLTTPVLWSNLTGNTTIAGSAFRSAFAAVYAARQALLNTIYERAKTLADAAQETATSAGAAAGAAQAAADDAQSAADDAQVAADAALFSLSEIISDDLLTIDEKPRVIMDRDVVVAEQAGIDAQATAYAITAEKTTYDTAVASLTTYLATLTAPVLWSNLTGNTTIAGSAFRAAFAAVYAARQALLNKIYEAAKALANAAQDTANDAAASAALAQNAADARTTTWVQAEIPIPNRLDDLWVDKGSLNLLRYSEQFDNPYWLPNAGLTVAPDAAANPLDGAMTADRLTESVVNGYHYISDPVFEYVAGNFYVASCYVQAAGRNYCRLALVGTAFATLRRISVNLTTGLISSITGTPEYYAAEDVGGGWWRISIGHTATATVATHGGLVYIESSAGLASYQGDGVSGINVYGGMITQGVSPGPFRYIRTDGVPVSTVNNHKMYRWDGAGWESVQDYGISQALLNAAVAQAAADDAQLAADTAQDAADTANTDLADIASDDILTPDEKPRVIMDRDVIVAEQAGIDAQATAYAITAEKTTYDTAVASLTTYLATLTTPVLWSNLTGNTTIAGSAFRAAFAGVYAARQSLLNKIYDVAHDLAAAASLTAQWDQVSGAGKPEDGADVTGNHTANDTAHVAGSLAATVANNAAAAMQAVTNMSADGVLSAQEKASWRVQWPGMDANYNAVIDQAAAYGLGADPDITALVVSYSTLGGYLTSTLQVWGYPDDDAVISPATQLIDYVDDYYARLGEAVNVLTSYSPQAAVDAGVDTTTGGLIVRNVTSGDYSQLTAGDLTCFFNDGIGNFFPYKSLKKVLPGVANNGVLFTIPGYWRTAPQIFPSLKGMPVYKAAYSTVDQRMDFSVDAPAQISTGKWQTRIYARLNTGTGVCNYSWSNISAYKTGPTWEGMQYVTTETDVKITLAGVVTITVSGTLAWEYYSTQYNTVASVEVYYYWDSNKVPLYSQSLSGYRNPSLIITKVFGILSNVPAGVHNIKFGVTIGYYGGSGSYTQATLSDLKSICNIGAGSILATGDVNYLAYSED